MFASLSSAWMLRLKKYGYWIWLIVVLGIPLSYWWSLGSDSSQRLALADQRGVGLIPIPRCHRRPRSSQPEEASEVPEMEAQATTAYCPWPPSRCCWACSVWSGWILAHETRWDWVGQLGWILSVGTVMGAIGITVSHELIHRTRNWNRTPAACCWRRWCYVPAWQSNTCAATMYTSRPRRCLVLALRPEPLPVPPARLKHNFSQRLAPEAERPKRRPAGPALAQRVDLVVRHQRLFLPVSAWPSAGWERSSSSASR